MSSLIIRGGQLIDGTRSHPFTADILIKDGRIAKIGQDFDDSGVDVLDASGAYVTPGFIDSHTHYDPAMFWDPLTELVHHGITTAVIGNCGLGLAPVKPSDRGIVSDMFAYIEDIPKGVFTDLIPWNWESFAEYVAVLGKRHYAVNVGSLVSHSLLRQFVIGAEAWERHSTASEANQVARQLEMALEAGALGLSTSFFDRDADGRRVPSFLADDYEMEALFAVLGKHGRVLQVIPDHPNLTDVCSTLERLGRLGAWYDVPILSNAIGDMPSIANFAETLLACARRIRDGGCRFYHMLSPRSIEMLANFEQTIMFFNMPVWNGMIQVDHEKKLELLRSESWRCDARDEWDEIDNFLFRNHHPEGTRIVSVGSTDNEKWVGRSLADLIAERGGHPSDVLANWLIENDIKAEFVVPQSNLDPDVVGELLRQPEVLVSASDAGAHYRMLCGVGDGTLILTRHVREHGHLTIEDAVAKLTADQADFLGLKDRGRLVEGQRADITIFALDELKYEKEEMTVDIDSGITRFTRPPGNYRHTIVNGNIAQSSGDNHVQYSGNII